MFDLLWNRPPTEEGVKLASCGKAIYSDDLTFVGGTHSAKLSIVGGDKKQEVTANLPGPSVSKTSTSHMDNFLKAAAGIDPECNSKFAISGPLTQVFMLGCIAQRLGENLEFDAKTRQITNNERANQLLKGNKPRKGWEEFYRLS